MKLRIILNFLHYLCEPYSSVKPSVGKVVVQFRFGRGAACCAPTENKDGRARSREPQRANCTTTVENNPVLRLRRRAATLSTNGKSFGACPPPFPLGSEACPERS
jgi:hypothetical protein